MKIVLFSLNASRSHTSLALCTLAAALRRGGFDNVVLIERTAKESSADTLGALYRENADLYGFSTYIWNLEGHLRLAENLKSLLPNTHIAFGGPEVSYHGEAWLSSHPFIDTLLRGEGEETVVTLCRALEENKPPRILDGNLFKDFALTPAPYQAGDTPGGSIVYYESSRGCPYACAYCLSSLHGTPRVRAKSVADTLKELKLFESMEGIRIVKFLDRTFNFDKKRAYAIWKALLSEEYTKKYHFEVCASLLDADTLALLSSFPKGKLQLEVGVQSTDPTVLAAINRRNDTEAVLANLETLTSFGNIHIHADLIAGLPYESYEGFGKSFNHLYGKCHMLQLGFLKLLHGSPLAAEREKYHYITTAEPPYEVLANDFIDYNGIWRLKRIEAVLERFGNSGRFTRAMAVLTENRAPFTLFEALAEAIPNPTLLSQRDAYLALLTFEESLAENPDPTLSTDPARQQRLTEALALDFLTNEQGHLPAALSFYPIPLTREEKDAFKTTHPEAFLPAVECYSLPLFGRILVDRKNHRVYGV